MQDKIIIKGARQHNLKNIDLELPKNKLVVFTGLSGSGKSSMAFDTIYAEGQRRYVESLSSYARQFLGVMDKPDVDSITGLSPAISIDQKSTSHNPRSTVGTVTEIYDYLRLLFARVGHPHCPNCGREISRLSIPQITDLAIDLIQKELTKNPARPARFLILSPVIRDRKGEFTQLFNNLRSKGFTKIRIDGKILPLSDDLVLIKTNRHTVEVVIDRISADKKTFRDETKASELKHRISESIEQAIGLSEGLVILARVDDTSFEFPDKPTKLTNHLFSERFACPYCNISVSELEPRLFSFNTPHGACPTCTGLGIIKKIDPLRVLNPNLSISEGGILPYARLVMSETWYGRILVAACKVSGIDIRKPIRSLTEDQKNQLLYGTGDAIYDVQGENRQGRMVTIHETYSGVIPDLERRYTETESDYVRNEIGKFIRDEICSSCQGKRLKKDALSVTINQKSIVDITSLSISDTIEWIEVIVQKFTSREQTIGNLILKEIKSRLTFLRSVGLDYLTLDRSAISLSGGEAQRIRLASQIGSGLSGVLYVLDEPSIGLHSRDNSKLINTLKDLRDLGNTVVVVEHDREMMQNADYLVDFGPGAGGHGGKVVSKGTYLEVAHDKNSITGAYLTGKKTIDLRQKMLIPDDKNQRYLVMKGCEQNNLKNINVKIPLGKIVCVTGVSGSGKSSLVVDTIHPALASHFNPYFKYNVGKHYGIEGVSNLERVILIDQSPIGRTPRSNPATYTGAFTFIRDIFSQTHDARVRGYNPGRFSFNVKGGRCEACEGEGEIKIEMQFLPDVYVTCDVCKGTRFNQETLEVKFKDKNISDVLNMTVEEADEFFKSIPGLSSKLSTLNKVGLSYIHLGQPAPQLSGGEAQRVKLATELSKKGTHNTLYILDEPTTGLHFEDLRKLVVILRELVNLGNTVVVIEHNLDIIKNSDWIIDLGPMGGEKGGYVIAEGTPETVAQVKSSYTGQFLKSVL